MKVKITSKRVISPHRPFQFVKAGASLVDGRPRAKAEADLICAIQQAQQPTATFLSGKNRTNPTAGFLKDLSSERWNAPLGKGVDSSSLSVMQRAARDIPADFWQACVQVIPSERKVALGRELNPERKEDVKWVLEELEKENEWQLYQELARCWNRDQTEEEKIQAGTPTEQSLRDRPPVPMRGDIAFLGSDKPSKDLPYMPDDILRPAVELFRALSSEKGEERVPIHMASFLAERREFYGGKVDGSNLSEANLAMLQEIASRRAAVLLLHPNVEATRSTKEERDRMVKVGYRPDPGWVKNFSRGVGGFDMPMLYRRGEGGEVDPGLMEMLCQVAEDYIRRCQEAIQARARSLHLASGRRGGRAGRSNASGERENRPPIRRPASGRGKSSYGRGKR